MVKHVPLQQQLAAVCNSEDEPLEQNNRREKPRFRECARQLKSTVIEHSRMETLYKEAAVLPRESKAQWATTSFPVAQHHRALDLTWWRPAAPPQSNSILLAIAFFEQQCPLLLNASRSIRQRGKCSICQFFRRRVAVRDFHSREAHELVRQAEGKSARAFESRSSTRSAEPHRTLARHAGGAFLSAN